jgi:hypothetical protein
MQRTFRNLKPVLVGGEETGAFRIELPRLKIVVSAIAHALYFRDNKKKHRGSWHVFAPSLGFAPTVCDGKPDPWDGLRRLVESGQYTPMSVPHPEVFSYGVHPMEQGQIIYKFTFYERVVVNAWTYFETYVQHC